MILVIFIKAVAELGVIPYTHLFKDNFVDICDVKLVTKDANEGLVFFGADCFTNAFLLHNPNPNS